MWIAVGVLTAHAHAADGLDQAVNQEAIVITLPVFVISICSTAAFTWTIAKWDNIRTRKVDELERRVNELLSGKPKDEQP